MTDRIASRSPTTRIGVTLPVPDWDLLADVAGAEQRTIGNMATVVIHQWCESRRKQLTHSVSERHRLSQTHQRPGRAR